jgi:hypothetical protein
MVTSSSAWLSGGYGQPYNPNRGNITASPSRTVSTSAPHASFIPKTYSAPPSAPTPPTVAGLEPAAYDAILFGKVRPKFLGGIALMGGRIVEGPFFGGSSTDPTMSAIYYLAEAADPDGTRTITELRIRGALAAFDGSGNLTDAQFAGAVVEFKTGTATQTPCAQSTLRYGADAIAYRPGILISITDLPLKPLAGIVPLISGKIEDTTYGPALDGISYTNLIKTILRDGRFDDSDFDVDVQGDYLGGILAAEQSLLDYLQNERKLKVHLNIGYTDKIVIREPTDFSIAIEVTNANFVRGSMTFVKTDPMMEARELRSNYIDQDRDYEPMVVVAREDNFPLPSTSAVNSEEIERPVISTASQETADVHVALYERLAVRSQMQATLLTSLFGTEPGDGVRYADHAVINYAGRAFETQHDYEKWQVQITAGEVLNCEAEGDDGNGNGDGDGEDGESDVAGITVALDETPNGSPWLEIASLACTDNGLMCGSFFFRAQRFFDTTSQSFWASNGNTSPFGTVYIDGTDDYISGGMATDSSIDFIFANTSPVPREVIHHCLFSMDTSVGDGDNVEVIYIDGVLASTLDTVPVPPTSTAFTPPFNGRDFVVFSMLLGGSGPEFTGDIWRMWLAPGQKLHEVDGTISEETIAKFLGVDGRPMNLGSNGSIPTGVAPAVYFDGDADDFGTNRGTGGAFTQTGTFTTAVFP